MIISGLLFSRWVGFNGDFETTLRWWGFAKRPWLTLKHLLYIAQVPSTLIKAIREIPIQDKKDEFTQER